MKRMKLEGVIKLHFDAYKLHIYKLQSFCSFFYFSIMFREHRFTEVMWISNVLRKVKVHDCDLYTNQPL